MLQGMSEYPWAANSQFPLDFDLAERHCLLKVRLVERSQR
jgi:hypothetical protein